MKCPSRAAFRFFVCILLLVVTGCTPTTDKPVPSGGSRVVPGAAYCDYWSYDRIFFDFDSATIKQGFREILDHIALVLKQNPTLTITIEGHTDERGTREYNFALGAKRAEAMRRNLIARGVPEARIKVISYGKDRPDMPGSNDVAWARNRRAVAVDNAAAVNKHADTSCIP